MHAQVTSLYMKYAAWDLMSMIGNVFPTELQIQVKRTIKP